MGVQRREKGFSFMSKVKRLGRTHSYWLQRYVLFIHLYKYPIEFNWYPSYLEEASLYSTKNCEILGQAMKNICYAHIDTCTDFYLSRLASDSWFSVFWAREALLSLSLSLYISISLHLYVSVYMECRWKL